MSLILLIIADAALNATGYTVDFPTWVWALAVVLLFTGR